MKLKKKIFAIVGSASNNSSSEKLIEFIADVTRNEFEILTFKDLKKLPHFDPELSIEYPPKEVIEFRKNIELADGVLVCTPEYIFSIPAGLKNAIEWCVSTTIFSGKPTGFITASASGQKGHEELQMILKTIMCNLDEAAILLIQGVKGKVDNAGNITDAKTKNDLMNFIDAFRKLVD